MTTIKQKKSINRTKAPLFAIIPFFFVLVFFALWSFLDVDNEYSAEEARSLAQRPVFDLHRPQQIIAGLEEYAVDQFPGRSMFLEAYSRLELLQRKVSTRNAYVEDGWIFSRTYKLADSAVDDLVAAAESVAERGIPTVYAMLPVKNYLVAPLPSLHVDDASEYNRQKFIEAFDGSEVRVSDIAGEMATQSEETRMAQWYATDFHWNGDGACAAVQKLIEDMAAAGLMPEVELREIATREVWDAEYMGDLSRRFSNLFRETQPVVVYQPKDTSGLRYYKSADGSAEVERSTIVASGRGAASVDYGGAYTPNLAYYRVENPNAAVDMRVVIFKDSLQDAMTDLLSAVFSELVVVDARYAQQYSVDEMIGDADAVVFMFHQNNAAPDTAKLILGK